MFSSFRQAWFPPRSRTHRRRSLPGFFRWSSESARRARRKATRTPARQSHGFSFLAIGAHTPADRSEERRADDTSRKCCRVFLSGPGFALLFLDRKSVV